MKKLIFTLLMVGFVVSAHSQIKLGLRAGVSSSSVNMDNLNWNTSSGDYKIIPGDAKVGMHFGGMVRAEFAGMYVQPELIFNSLNSEIKVEDLQTGETRIKDQRFKKIDIPILIGPKFGPFRANVGPVATFILSGKGIDEIDGHQVEEDYKSASWGFQAGVGLDVWKLTVDLKYEGNLSAFGDGVTILGSQQNFDARTSQWILSVGYFFNK